MKFLRVKLLTSLLFFGFVAIFLISACEKNTCNNVTCFNGGSCNVGACRCPTGWEGSQCSNLSVDRFIHGYKGLTRCNAGAFVIDSVWIVGDALNMNFVFISQKSYPGRVWHGYISSTSSVYSVIVASDTGYHGLYQMDHTITLQNNKTLNVHTFTHDTHTPGVIIDDECYFQGDKY